MRLNCYTCDNTLLTPLKLDNTLSALRCTQCQGTYIDLLDYREWLSNDVASNPTMQYDLNLEDFNIQAVQTTETPIKCLRCSRTTSRYRVNSEVDNTINVCHNCDDVWLDKGEWKLLKYLSLEDRITEVIGRPFQKEIREGDWVNDFKDIYRKKIGDGFDTVETFAQWFIEQPNKAEILHYLKER